MKRKIRLTEGDLRRIVKQSVRRVLRESANNDIIQCLAKEYNADPQSIRQRGKNNFEVPINGQYHDVFVFNNEQEACDYLWREWDIAEYCENAAPTDYWMHGASDCFDENGVPDWNCVAQTVLDTEGPAWFLDGYDGQGTILDNGMIAYRYD